MSVASVVTIGVNFSGDVSFAQEFETGPSSAGPGAINLFNLVSGDNVIVVPTGVNGLIMIPEAGNTETLILKGNAADVGIAIHPTNPMYLSVDDTVTSFIINSTGDCDIRLVRS